MSDAQPKSDVNSTPETHGGIDVKYIGKFVTWFTIIFCVCVFTLVIVVVNPTTAQNFIYFLQGLQILFVLVIIFCFYKMQYFRKEYLKVCHHIDHLYAEKNGQGHHAHNAGEHEHGHEHGGHSKDKLDKLVHKKAENILEERFQRAVKSVSSQHVEEWRVGLIELDKILKDALIKKGFRGETLDELFSDARDKNFSGIENAETATRAKRFLTKDMVKLPDIKEHKIYKDVAMLYKVVLNELI